MTIITSGHLGPVNEKCKPTGPQGKNKNNISGRRANKQETMHHNQKKESSFVRMMHLGCSLRWNNTQQAVEQKTQKKSRKSIDSQQNMNKTSYSLACIYKIKQHKLKAWKATNKKTTTTKALESKNNEHRETIHHKRTRSRKVKTSRIKARKSKTRVKTGIEHIKKAGDIRGKQ